jgi:hypothetical protein
MAKEFPRRLKRLSGPDLIQSVGKLSGRIAERFPDRGLARDTHDFASHAQAFVKEANGLSKRNRLVESGIAFLALVGFGGALFVLAQIPWIEIEFSHKQEFFQAMQGIDAAIHIAISVALVIVFVANRERRRKRKIAFNGLTTLRNFAYVIDSHQLDKDPAAFAAGLPVTASSPKRDLEPPELLRYLDYCSELLSFVSKFAALYGQEFRDSAVIEAIDDIDMLTGTLSNKIWQKIAMLNSFMAHAHCGGYAKQSSIEVVA